MYYFFIENGKLNGCGQCECLNDNIQNIEVTEEVFNTYIEDNLRYIWDGENVIDNPNYEADKQAQEREELNHLSLTKREVFLALYKDKGITPEQIKASITSPEALIEFEYATEYFRGNPLIDAIGLQLGYTSEDLDYLFQNGELP